MSHCDAPGLLPIEQAIELQLSQIQPISEVETVPLQEAQGRVLATDIHSPVNVPPLDNSAMDGYAFAWREYDGNKDHPLTLHCVGESLAGHMYNGKVQGGQCVRIMTGAIVPEGSDTVVMQENVDRLEDASIRIHTPPGKLGQNVRNTGEDIAQDQQVLAKGTRINAAHLAMLGSIGVPEITVVRKIKVAVLATGDELTPPGQPLQPGHIYESNRIGLIAMLRKLDTEILDLGIIPDDKQAISDAFERAANECDWVISSGGVSVGDADFVKEVLDECGDINFWKVAIKPGKPYAFGSLKKGLKNGHFSGLPGNPVSAFVTFHQLVVPALKKLAGDTSPSPIMLNAKSTSNIRKRPGRTEYQRGRFYLGDKGSIEVNCSSRQGSNIMSSFFESNCYVVLELDRGSVETGETVPILPFDPLLQ